MDQIPSAFRLLAPHQDLQFVCDRLFFFMDDMRTFMATSTGSSGKRTLPDLGAWVTGNLATAWRADYFPPDPALPNGNGIATNPVREVASLTVLAPGPGGRRTAREIVPVNLQPQFSPRTLVPTFWTTREYRFVNFHHPFVCDFEKTLNRQGMAALLSLETQSASGVQSFDDSYNPEPRVLEAYPADEVEFQPGRAYELYNWELFFHIPLLIAERLRANQRFAEAQRWFHFIFDPTGASGGAIPQRYWRTKPFHDRLREDYESESVKTIEEMVANGPSEELRVAVEIWRNNPFGPHAVARLRTTAYQKSVVMKYIDNLIAWGDQLFRSETLESINEAMQLYVLAAEVLGRRPEVMEHNLKPAVETFNTIEPKLGALGNALEQIELLVPDAGDIGETMDSSQTPDLPSNTVLYFCVPENDKLLGYWSTVSDRLFKIRNCMDIEGQVRQLPLFEPPIDPALLVRARAAGLSIGEVLSDIDVSLPNYRFSVMLQKANELAAEVRNLGASLLSALEKRDAEALSLLRSGQEMRLLEAVREVRVRQITEAETNIAALKKSHEMVRARKDYYESREFVNQGEQGSLDSLGYSRDSVAAKFLVHALAAVLMKIGNFKFGSPTTAGIEVGAGYWAAGLSSTAALLDATASVLSIQSQLEGKMADYDRRQDEWIHQANLANIELKQIDQQLVGAEIRLAVAEQELRNHDRQIENARDVDRHLRDKFTNQDLYQWMIGQISGLYFQSYQLAYELAKRAERCLRFELGLQDSSYISFGYWDSLKKGLLSGEKLQYDLHRLETAYLDQNSRKFELTKHVSLALLNPLALVQLRETGRCSFHLPEEIFDLDFPGHYFRRIKSVSLTLPCVVGPYTTISCTLRLLDNSIRINTTDGTDGYPHNTDADGLPADDDRFMENSIPVQAIAASNAQNDSGVFELSFRDERYLPFEGAGAISKWSLELFSDNSADFGKPLRQFDYDSISDAVMHVKYTAREDAAVFKDNAVSHLRDYFSRSQAEASPSVRMLDLRQEFPSQWYRFLNPTNPADGNVFELEVSPSLFPMRDLSKTLKINTVWLLARCTSADPYEVVMTLPPPAGANTVTLSPANEYGGLHFGSGNIAASLSPEAPIIWQLQMTRAGANLQATEVEDLLLVLGYEWE
ncbi:MAG TPA: hypothetical protein VKA25_01680 [Gemmatimonadales bacterium]|nr:hypothetical protein [Gemmatimonadales bacterium]